jgi:hypothetical protein
MIDFMTNTKGMNEIRTDKLGVMIPDEMVEILDQMTEADFYVLKKQIATKFYDRK